MLNKLGRKRISIVVAPRKPTAAEIVDSEVTVIPAKTEKIKYYEMRVGKFRGGHGGQLIYGPECVIQDTQLKGPITQETKHPEKEQ